ncbi:YihY/virulence factor BrkB family protein [Georgenia wangjunii]|uniref:YihY/virulence factor BrkB family protein n=1 Tax=Georgenia wangjunii TaxID=3117730 RepID=UPI002F2621C1
MASTRHGDGGRTQTAGRTGAEPEDGRKPDGPTDLTKPSWGYTLRKTLREFGKDQCTDLAAALTYYAVLSLFPALIALVSILGLVGQAEATTDTLLQMASDFVPQDTLDQIEPIIASVAGASGASIGLIIGILTALWTASNYVNAFGRAMNRIYEIPEGRPIWKLRPIMYGITALLLVLVALVGVMLVVSGPVAQAVGDAIGLGSTAVTVWNIAKWPVVLVAIIVIVALLYYFTPNVKQPKFTWISVGAIVAIVVALLASVGLGFYVANFGSYDATYGALAGVIVFLLWIYVMNLALLFGAELDAELERSRELQGGIAAEETIQLPPRDTKASDKKAEKEQEDIAKGRELRESAGRNADADE